MDGFRVYRDLGDYCRVADNPDATPQRDISRGSSTIFLKLANSEAVRLTGRGGAAVSISAKRLNGVDSRCAGGWHQRGHRRCRENDCCRSDKRKGLGEFEFWNVIAGQAR